MKRFLSLMVVSAISFLVPTMAFASEDKDCGDFKTWSDAQNYFESKGGSKSNNVDGLDRNHDGIVCESLRGYQSGHSNPNDKPSTPTKEDPKTPQQPNTPDKNTDNKPQQGAPLPKTASPFANSIAFGVLLLVGGTVVLLRKRSTT